MSNEYLSRTPNSSGNRRTFTISAWVKSQILSTGNMLLHTYSGGQDFLSIQIGNSSTQSVGVYQIDASVDYSRYWAVAQRDYGAWTHHLFSIDTTQADEDKRLRYFINGTEVTEYYDTYGTFPQNFLFKIDNTRVFNIFRNIDTSTYGNTLASDYFFVDGQALTPDVFGKFAEGRGTISAGTKANINFRPGQWIPRAPKAIVSDVNSTGGFGVNGVYLPLNDGTNFGADFHCAPNTIIKLREDLQQPKYGLNSSTLNYKDALRTDAYKDFLVLAVPFVSGGLDGGLGDYSAHIKGTGSNKVLYATNQAGIRTAPSFYGSALYLDGTDSYISIPNHEDFRLTNNDFTIECWIYNSGGSTPGSIINLFENATARRSWSIETRGSNGLRFEWWYDGTTSNSIDAPSNTLMGNQWNHIAVARKRGTISLFVNGTCVGTNTSVGVQSFFNNITDPVVIGALVASGTPTQDYGGYIQDVRIYKGVAKYTSGFDVVKPITPNGMSSWRALSDNYKNNFCTVNSASRTGSDVASVLDGGTLLLDSQTAGTAYYGSFPVASGKWYYEAFVAGVAAASHLFGWTGTDGGSRPTDGAIWARNNGQKRTGSTATNSALPSWVSNDIIMIAYDFASNKMWFGKNGVWYSDATTTITLSDIVAGNGSIGSHVTYSTSIPLFAYDNVAGSKQTYINFGQNPTFSGNTTTGTFADSNGKGQFKYQPPTGFLALCTDNLPTPAISDPSKHFKSVLYTGNGTYPRSITGIGFQPDLIWIKDRSIGTFHRLYNSISGPLKGIYSNATGGEVTEDLQSFDSDGFTLKTDSYGGGINNSGNSYVAWCWKAGSGVTSTNTSGSITSTVSVNQTAGFSIVSWTGDGVEGATIGHGLSKPPKFIIAKVRNTTAAWRIWHSQFGDTYGLGSGSVFSTFDTAAASYDSQRITGATSTTFRTTGTISPYINGSSDTYIAYCWTEIDGFSKFGVYSGNENADGPFVYCGFRPAFVMVKWISGGTVGGTATTAGNWFIVDSSRNPLNPTDARLYPNLTTTENALNSMDFTSTGFKIRDTGADMNNSGGNYIFIAFAETPLKVANSK